MSRLMTRLWRYKQVAFTGIKALTIFVLACFDSSVVLQETCRFQTICLYINVSPSWLVLIIL